MRIDDLNQKVKKSFKENLQVMSFEEYVKIAQDRPSTQLRGSAQYTADMLDFYGKENGQFKIFKGKVIGLEKVQSELYQVFRAFERIGTNNRVVLLHGPNGSAKSTLIASILDGLSLYSHETNGALYTFSWIFPIEKIVRGSLGIRGDQDKKSSQITSYAYLPDEDIACILPSELRDHPLLLIPASERFSFFKDISWKLPKRLTDGGLSHRDQLIFQALLTSYQGDYAQVLKHIRVERFFLSTTYRSGLVTIEPQMHVDAHYQQLTMNRSLSQLPASLQGINLFSLSGDLADANRGAIDYNDLLKRPIDSFKYLLTTSETGKVNVGNSILHLDTLFLASSNELQLDAFKEYPDFSSFKGRMELVRVPYLLKMSDERQVYEPMLKSISGNKPVSPHTSFAVAMWSVLTRLKKPHPDSYPSVLGSVIQKLTPLDKLRIYDTGELPERLSNEERKQLKANLHLLEQEYESVLFYEGRTGASARELKSLLIDAAQNPEFKTLSPLSVVHELRKFVKRVSEYDFLRQEPVDGYHDPEAFIEVVLDEYATLVDREVRECLGLYETAQWGDFMKRYIQHLSSFLKKEKIKNPITGTYEDPDPALMSEFELIAGAPTDTDQKNEFRQNLITQIGAWVLDHPKEPIDYFRVFPEVKQKIEKHFYESQKSLLQKMNLALKQFGTDHDDPTSEGSKLARLTLENMQKKFGYHLDGAKEVIGFLMSRRYSN